MALTTASLLEPTCSLEWIMHFQIARADVPLHWKPGLEVRPSDIKKSRLRPDLVVGFGLWTKADFNKDDLLCSFPGYWLHDEHAKEAVIRAKGQAYPFSLPVSPDYGWPAKFDLVYMSHSCDANFINAGRIGEEVHNTQALTARARSHACRTGSILHM